MKVSPPLFQLLVSHQWKETVRSSYWEKGLLIRILLAIMFLYVAINLVILGVFMGRIIGSAFPDDDPAWGFSLVLFYYFIADIILRFFLQPVPALSISPYMHLPVRRSSLFNFLLVKSALSLFNFIPLLILLPFVFKTMLPHSAWLYTASWLAAIILFVFANNYLAFLLKKAFLLKPFISFILLAAAGLLILADVRSAYSISGLFATSMLGIAGHPFLLSIPLLAVIIAYSAAWYFLNVNRYIEADTKKERMLFSGKGSGVFDAFGITGRLALMEIKLTLRNNRPRTYLIMGVFFLLYGMMIYPPHAHPPGMGMFIFVGLLITGILMIQHGQLIMAWESCSFDKICTCGLKMHDYFRGKYWFFFMVNSLSFLITLPYCYYGYKIALINLAAFLYNSGINSFIILFLGTYNTRRIDLGKGAFFNYEGANFIHFLLAIPLLGLPVLIWLPFSFMGNPDMGIMVIGLAGVAGMIFSEFFIRQIVRQFNTRKYKILNGFRTR
ncbi:MAG: DUF5687 family protein [Bacteroidota bacterium]